ncbi:hypothetical protein BUALT_Bualt04G0065300 [Buddleja alternifolia]|uniref:Patellin-3 n=1 Tax=Buddleja alternifolia TaxID=168488 RepID=A0AAV6XLU0_9LAMI|nr:hypothetical protein BUALT_Bualt04G0065300 [Buddleja alternifolia]
MAEQVEKLAQEQTTVEPTKEALLVVTDVPESEHEEEEKDEEEQKQSLLVPEPELIPANNAYSTCCGDEQPPLKTEQDKSPHPKPTVEVKGTKIAHLPPNEQKALLDLKNLLQQAINNHEFSISSSSPKQEKIPLQTHEQTEPQTEKDPIPGPLLEDDDGTKTLEAIEETIVHSSNSNPTEEKMPHDTTPVNEVSIWGVKLLEDDKTDVILLKFLRARDFKVKDAFNMMKNTIRWRREFGIDQLVEEEDDLGCDELERAVFMHGYSKEGHPVCYNVYGEFKNKELYQKMFSDEEKRMKFLKWRILFLEKSIRKLLDFSPAAGVSTIVHVNDLKNSPGPNRWELRQATNQALHLFQDNYPEFVAKQVFINVPWWYLALSKMISPFLTQRTKSKFVVAGPSGSTETLLKYICAEQIPTQIGGLSKDGGDFERDDCVTEIMVKPSGKHIVEFPVTQEECIVRWEARVVGWEVSYGAEFVPSAKDGYTVIIQKMRRIDEDQVISSSYRAGEAGKLVFTIKNLTSKKKKLLYRFKTIYN